MTHHENKKQRRPYNRACVNCRRKKTRCPGEKPFCSSCVRLNQKCFYKHTAGAWHDSRSTNGEISFSVSRQSDERGSVGSDQHREIPEELLEETDSFPEALYSQSGCDTSLELYGTPSCHLPTCHGTQDTSLQWSLPDLTEAVQLYFQCCHRQPIWLFEREEIGNLKNLPDQLSFTILALTSRFRRRWKFGQHCAVKTRISIMEALAKGMVTIITIESLCLLSYHYFIDGNLQLGRFHLGLGFQLCQSAALDRKLIHNSSDASSERKKRLFWSVHLLEQFYGQQNGLINVTTEVGRVVEQCVDRDHELRKLDDNRQVPLPIDVSGEMISDGPGIWSLTLKMSWIWSRTRTYMFDCESNRLKSPWRHDSTYNMILSDLIESENQFPIAHRYDSAKFWERTIEEVQANQTYWNTWMKTQIMYHAIHTVLNHPFLYIVASQYNQDLAIPNTFWRRSSEQALLHATWIVRLIDMISDKKVRLTDPFFAHAAAIASTLHLYYCCAADPRLRHKSSTDLDKCRKFLRSFAPFSKACEALDKDFDEMSRIAFTSANSSAEEESPPKIRLSTCLMWNILQFQSMPATEQNAPSSLLHQSLAPDDSSLETQEGAILEIIVATSPDVTVDTADGGQAAPVTPLKGVTFSTADAPTIDTLCDAFIAPADSLMLDTSWMWADSSQLLDGSDMDQVDSNSVIGNLEASTWWNFGNL